MGFFTPLRIALAAILFALLGVGGEMYSVNPCVSLYIWIVAGILGIVVIWIYIVVARRNRKIRDKLAEFLRDGEELFHRRIHSQEEYEKIWEPELDAWCNNLSNWVGNKISLADSIRVMSRADNVPALSFGITYGDQNKLLNALAKILTNLRTLFDRYHSGGI